MTKKKQLIDISKLPDAYTQYGYPGLLKKVLIIAEVDIQYHKKEIINDCEIFDFIDREGFQIIEAKEYEEKKK